jgi:pimeloyl-ACP methyl ester carboxylesterase
VTPEAWEESGREYQHRGHRIFYRTEGEGPPLLLIHGFPTSSWDWHKIWSRLAARFTVIAPDLIGFGFSDKPPRYEYRIVDQADLVSGLLFSLGMRRVGVLAHDYGDSVAQELLARVRAKWQRLLELDFVCFLNGGLYPEMHRARPIQRLLASPLGPLLSRFTSERRFRKSFSAVFGSNTRPSDEELRAFWSITSRNGGIELAPRLLEYIAERRRHRTRWVAAIEEARCPLRLIDGPDDPVSGLHLAEHYRARVPNADVVLLPGIGHYPQTEAPDDVVREFFSFVDRSR